MYSPTQSTNVSIAPTSDVAKPASSGSKKKKAAKRKRTKVDTSFQKQCVKDIPTDSGHPLTPLTHSLEVTFGVLKHATHTHGESPHNLPSPSQQGDVGV